MTELDRTARRQYRATDPLKIRLETHEKYSDRPDDLDRECQALMVLEGSEAILDVGCGPGRFPIYLRERGHQGLLVGLDQSTAMLDEARDAAVARSLIVDWLRGDAGYLPLASDSFDWVVARHMLYHLPDIPAALREMGRVAGPGGRVIVSTNGARSLPRISELRHDLAVAFDLPDALGAVPRFSSDNAEELLGAAYPVVEPVWIENALIFTSAEPIVRYVATSFPSLDPASAPIAELERWLIAEVTERLARLNGVWRDPKNVVFYRCLVGGSSG